MQVYYELVVLKLKKPIGTFFYSIFYKNKICNFRVTLKGKLKIKLKKLISKYLKITLFNYHPKQVLILCKCDKNKN